MIAITQKQTARQSILTICRPSIKALEQARLMTPGSVKGTWFTWKIYLRLTSDLTCDSHLKHETMYCTERTKMRSASKSGPTIRTLNRAPSLSLLTYTSSQLLCPSTFNKYMCTQPMLLKNHYNNTVIHYCTVTFDEQSHCDCIINHCLGFGAVTSLEGLPKSPA